MPAPQLQRRPEVAAIRDLELAARALVAGLRHGRHASPLVGAGPEVWGVRPYRQGDDAAQVDWRRSARVDRLYSRERVDASQTQALVVVDASRSMAVGHATGMPTKIEVARIVAAAFVTLLIEQGDTVGLTRRRPRQRFASAGGRGPSRPRAARGIVGSRGHGSGDAVGADRARRGPSPPSVAGHRPVGRMGTAQPTPRRCGGPRRAATTWRRCT